MKAFILAAGKGERLRPLTAATPKCLVSIQDTAILDIWLQLCRRNNINQVLINTHAHAETILKHLQRHPSGISIQTTYEPTLLGSAGTLRANREWICRDEEFWVFYGDVLTNADLTKMMDFHRQKRQIATLAVYKVANPRQCGIIATDADQIVRSFVEKPSAPESDLAFAGIMVASQWLIDAIPDHLPADLGFHVLPRLVGHMAAYPILDYLLDIGSPESYEYAQSTWPGLSAA